MPTSSAQPKHDNPKLATATKASSPNMINLLLVPVCALNFELTPGTYENSNERATPATNERLSALIAYLHEHRLVARTSIFVNGDRLHNWICETNGSPLVVVVLVVVSLVVLVVLLSPLTPYFFINSFW
jgi:hypothetical protein